jgi:peptidoglycan/LPS O-acetylase OafA/YrhL
MVRRKAAACSHWSLLVQELYYLLFAFFQAFLHQKYSYHLRPLTEISVGERDLCNKN